jgi:hypothetical protein
MPTVNYNITATGDDGYQEGGGSYFSTGQIYLGKSGSSSVEAGLRFLSVAVPAGATINSATLTLIGRSVSGTVTNVHGTIYGDDVDSAAAWSNSSLPTTITQTTASAAVNPSAWADGTSYGYDVTSIVAEIVARAGWATGNNIRFGIRDNSSTASNFIRAYDYGDAGSVSSLSITYTEGGGSTYFMPRIMQTTFIPSFTGGV